MDGSAPRHLQPDEAGTESRDAQSAWVGGGRTQLYLSAERFAAANEGSHSTRRPWVWAVTWVGGIVIVVASLILILR